MTNTQIETYTYRTQYNNEYSVEVKQECWQTGKGKTNTWLTFVIKDNKDDTVKRYMTKGNTHVRLQEHVDQMYDWIDAYDNSL